MNDSTAAPHPSSVPPTELIASHKSAKVSRARSLWLVWLGGVVGVPVVFGGSASLGAFHNWQNDARIAPNIVVAGVAVGGLGKNAATQKLQKKFRSARFYLLLDEEKISLSPNELGARPNFQDVVQKAHAIGRQGSPVGNFLGVWRARVGGENFMLPLSWDEAALRARLEKLRAQRRVAPRSARLFIEGEKTQVQSEIRGRELDVEQTLKAIRGRYFLGRTSIDAITREIAPAITTQQLEGRDIKIGEFSTRFNPRLEGRTENIRVSCRALEGHVLMPGEEFSFNHQTGQRTWAKGYRMAQIFERKPGAEKSEIVEGLAGGVCQTSSTLYNAVRKVNLKFERNPLRITERTSHSLPVNYVPPGRDAAVAWPDKDFRFVNVADYPVFLRAQKGRRTLTMEVWARVPRDFSVR